LTFKLVDLHADLITSDKTKRLTAGQVLQKLTFKDTTKNAKIWYKSGSWIWTMIQIWLNS